MRDSITYIGYPNRNGCVLYVRHCHDNDVDTIEFKGKMLGLDYVNHSPTGLSWGYHGSGCAQTAFSVLLDFFKRGFGFTEKAAVSVAKDYYQRFKDDVIAKKDMNKIIRIDGEEITDWYVEVTDNVSESVG